MDRPPVTHCDACPFKGCDGCPYKGGEVPVSQQFSGRMGVAKTNDPGLSPEAVLATPIRPNEQEDYPEW